MPRTPEEAGFRHPCAGTCSGYQQGVEEGRKSALEEIQHLRTALEQITMLSDDTDSISPAVLIARRALE